MKEGLHNEIKNKRNHTLRDVRRAYCSGGVHQN
jgi:hypothetical protein